MIPILKLLLFLLILLPIVFSAIWCYSKLNRKIIQSETLAGVLGYTALLILANIVLILGGIFLLLQSYEWLSGI